MFKSVKGLLCLFCYIRFLGMLVGVWLGDGLRRLARLDFNLCGGFGMESFLRMVILEGKNVNDFTTGGVAMECCLMVGEDGREDEEPIFCAAVSHFAFKASLI